MALVGIELETLVSESDAQCFSTNAIVVYCGNQKPWIFICCTYVLIYILFEQFALNQPTA